MTNENYAIFRQVLQGRTTRSIADKRGMSQAAVCNHLTRACQGHPGLHDAVKVIKRIHKQRGRPAGR